jgi:hypothetical protein
MGYAYFFISHNDLPSIVILLLNLILQAMENFKMNVYIFYISLANY